MTDYLELGKRLVACKHFRWMPGMLGLRWAPGYIDHGKPEIRISDSEDARIAKAWGCVPDLSDAATKGCVLQLIREALNNPHAYVLYYGADDGWYLHTKSQFWPAVLDTEAEAMVAALEAAP